MSKRSRRDVVAGTVAVLAGTAGCLDRSSLGQGGTERTTGDDGTTNRDGTNHTEGTTSTEGTTDGPYQERADLGDTVSVDDHEVRLRDARATRFIITLLAGVHPTISADRNRQYVVVELDVSGEDAPDAARAACELRIDDTVIEPMTDIVQPFTDHVHLAFSLSLDVDPDDVALSWVGESTTATWTLPDAVAASLAAPPDFEVRSFEVPATADGDEIEVSFTVGNVGEGDGAFLTELGTRALSDQPEVRVPLEAGETRTVTATVGLVTSVGDQPVVLDWGWDSLEQTVSTSTG